MNAPHTPPTQGHRENLPPMPAHIARLPLDDRGYPVPFFVQWIDGKPDFRLMDGAKLVRAVKEKRCWICGGQLTGRYVTFCVGPMCIVNLISAEPPSHLDCATFAVQACPFLVLPKAQRREADLPATRTVAGHMISRNPGVTAAWTTTRYTVLPVDNGLLFRMGPVEKVSWWAEGRSATAAEVQASFESGLVILRDMAHREGPDARAQVEHMIATARPLLLSTPSPLQEAEAPL